jgi:hypothetical protein
MAKQIKKAVIRGSLPIEGFRGVIFFTDGSYEKVLNKVIVEPYDLHGAFQHDFYPFDTQADAEAATRRRVRQLKAA